MMGSLHEIDLEQYADLVLIQPSGQVLQEASLAWQTSEDMAQWLHYQPRGIKNALEKGSLKNAAWTLVALKAKSEGYSVTGLENYRWILAAKAGIGHDQVVIKAPPIEDVDVFLNQLLTQLGWGGQTQLATVLKLSRPPILNYWRTGRTQITDQMWTLLRLITDTHPTHQLIKIALPTG